MIHRVQGAISPKLWFSYAVAGLLAVCTHHVYRETGTCSAVWALLGPFSSWAFASTPAFHQSKVLSFSSSLPLSQLTSLSNHSPQWKSHSWVFFWGGGGEVGRTLLKTLKEAKKWEDSWLFVEAIWPCSKQIALSWITDSTAKWRGPMGPPGLQNVK